MFAPPLAVITGVVGLRRDESRKYAIAGLVIGGLACLPWLLSVLCR